jgi:hypothetical protein
MAYQDASPAAERAARLLGGRLARWGHLTGAGGYTPAFRLHVELADGRTAFVKAATTDLTARFIRAEAASYDALDGCDFLPRRLGYEDDGARPVLVLEDLSAAYWPPPWRPGDVERVLETLAAVRPCAGRFAPGAPPSLADQRGGLAGWARVAGDPAPFLSLGMCSAAWLEVALPALLAADEAAPLDGGDLCHMDTRSDNLCFAGDARTLLVDWNLAAAGNGDLDVVAWLPSLPAEGGPAPEEALRIAGMPEQPELTALITGYFAARAGLPQIPDAPRVRHIQKVQLVHALPWAARALGLPPPDGPVFKTGG